VRQLSVNRSKVKLTRRQKPGDNYAYIPCVFSYVWRIMRRLRSVGWLKRRLKTRPLDLIYFRRPKRSATGRTAAYGIMELSYGELSLGGTFIPWNFRSAE